MKKLMMALLFCVGITGVSLAQDKAGSVQATSEVPLANAKKIEMEAVPEKVAEAFRENDYKAEDVYEIHEITEGNNKIYTFILNLAESKWAISFDATGKLFDKSEIKE